MEPKQVGSKQVDNLRKILGKALKDAIKVVKGEVKIPKTNGEKLEMKPMENFNVQMSVKFESSKDPNKPFGTSQKVHKGEPADTNKMLTDIFKQMQNLIQSNEEVFMKGFQMTFKFTEIPSGGTSTGQQPQEFLRTY